MNRHAIAAAWRKSTRSNGSSACVEVGCVHDAAWLKSSRSNGSDACVEVAELTASVAVRDSKLPTDGDFPYLAMSPADWTGLVNAIRTGKLDH
ncbi:MAG: DUF397 domain-containing protein [Stackebrandtia sp.]